MGSLNKPPSKVTPYTCQVLYQEIDNMKTRKMSISQFILKTDLMLLPRMTGITEISDAEIVNTCVNKLLEIDKMYNNTYDLFKQYMDGVGHIVSINKTLAKQGRRNLNDEVNAFGLSNSLILVYMFLGVRGRQAERSRMDFGELKSEIIREFKALKPLNQDNLLDTLHAKVDEINAFVRELQGLQDNYDSTGLMIKLDKIQDNLKNLSKASNKSDLKEIESKMHTILKNFEVLTTSINESEMVNINMIERYSMMMDVMVSRINKERERAEHFQKFLNNNNEEFKIQEQYVKNISEELEDILSDFRRSLHTTPMDSVINLINNITQNVRTFQGGVKGQTLAIKDIEEKLKSLSEGTKVLSEVVDQLHRLMRSDILYDVMGNENKIKSLLEEMKELGDNYIKWRDYH